MKELIEFLEKIGLKKEVDNLRNGGTTLSLQGKNIGDAGASILAVSLKDNTSLTQLDLSHNYICQAGASSLAASLKHNTSLTLLDLTWNNIGDAGASILAVSLKDNTSLTQLNLSCNNIGYAGVSSLAASLKDNTSLTKLDFFLNNIGYAGLKIINEYLQRNKTMLEQKADTLNAEANYLCDQEQYSEAIEKYKAAIKITKEALQKENKLYEENKAKAEKKYEEQQQSLKLKQTISVTNENQPAEVKDLPKEVSKQNTTQKDSITSEENIYEVMARMNIRLENVNNINETDKEILQNNIHNKVQKLGRNKPNLQKVAKSIKDIIDSDKITKGKLIDLEDEIDETIQQQAIINEGIRIDKLNIFKQTVEEVNTNLENSTSNNKAEMQNIINKIINGISKLTNIFDIEKITLGMKELTTGRITKGKLIDLEDKLNEIILEQLNKNAVETWAVKEIIYDKSLLNNPELLQAAVDNKLSSDLIHEAINDDDGELILIAGLMSVGYDQTPAAG